MMRWDRLAALRSAEVEWKAEWVRLTPGRTWVAYSHHGHGHGRVMLAGAPQIGGSAVHLGSWQSSAGAISLELTDEEAARYTMQRLTRGSLIEVSIRWRGQDVWKRVTVGQVHNLSGVRGRWSLQCWDLLTATRSRLVSVDSDRRLFSSAGHLSQLTSSYSPSDTTLHVVDTAPYERESGQPGVVKVTPSSGGDSFYVTYTGTSGGNQLTGVSSVDQFNTTRSAAAVGDLVANVPYIVGHPWEVVAKVWTSTGTGTNGRYDTLPAAWGLALPHHLVDFADLREWQPTLRASTGTYSWSVRVDSPVEDGRAWFGELLAPAGAWMVARDGRLCLRAVQDLDDIASTADVEHLDPRHVDRVNRHEPWAADVPVEHHQVVVSSAAAATTRLGTLGSLPTAHQVDVELPHVWSNDSAIVGEVAGRLAPWTTRIPEVMELATTWRYAGKVEGDVLHVLPRELGHLGLAEALEQHSLRWMVARVGRRLGNGTCTLTLTRHPGWEGTWPT